MPRRSQALGLTKGEKVAVHASGLVVALLFAGAIAASFFGFTASKSSSPRQITAPVASPTSQMPEEARRDINYYNPEPDKKVGTLKTLYSHAIHQAVHDKDTNTCANDLEKYREQLNGVSDKGIKMLESDHLPARAAALHPKRNAWICKTAWGMTHHTTTPNEQLLSSLSDFIDGATEYANQGDTEACYAIMRKDYRVVVKQADPATQIAASHNMLVLPGELTNEHLAGICSHPIGSTT